MKRCRGLGVRLGHDRDELFAEEEAVLGGRRPPGFRVLGDALLHQEDEDALLVVEHIRRTVWLAQDRPVAGPEARLRTRRSLSLPTVPRDASSAALVRDTRRSRCCAG